MNFSKSISNIPGWRLFQISLITFLISSGVYGQVQIIPKLPTDTLDGDWSALFHQPLRLQAVYGSSYFTNGPVTIFEIRYQRQKGSAPFTNVTVNARIAMSTTSKNPDGLSGTFASNVGTDEVVVFNGSISLSSGGTVTSDPASSPFDIIIPLTTPFTFDPSKGNFLIDYKNETGFIAPGVLGFARSADNASRLFSTNPTDPNGASDSAAEAIQLLTTQGNADIIYSPNGSGFTNKISIFIFSKLRAGQIRYTVDGTDPVPGSTLYTTNVTISETSTVKSRYFINGFPASDVYSAVFTKANPILFAPSITLFTNSLQISFTNTLGTGAIRYTTDGTAPTAASLLYSSPFTITNSSAVSAQLFLNNFAISDVYTTNYSRVYVFGNDGIPIAWRQQYFGSNYATDPRAAVDADSDNDGSTNLQEYNAGTNPLDPNSGFKISIRPVPLLTWPTQVNSNYNILRRASLSSGQFSVIATIKATNQTTMYIDLNAGTSSTQDYYSIQLAP